MKGPTMTTKAVEGRPYAVRRREHHVCPMPKVATAALCLTVACLGVGVARGDISQVQGTDFYFQGANAQTTYRVSELKSGWGYNNNLAQYQAVDGVYPYPGEGNNVYLRLGIFTIEDGDDLTYQDFLVGQGWGRYTTSNITGGKLTLSRAFYVGYWSDGHGCVNMSGGTVTAPRLTMCYNYGVANYPCVDSVFNLSGGILSLGYFSMCNNEASTKASFTLSDYGVMKIAAGGASCAFAMGYGQNSVASFKQTGGTFTVESGAYTHFGYAAGSTATYDMTGGEFTMHIAANGAFVVGVYGTGILNVSGGAVFSPTCLLLGEGASGSGTVNLGVGGTISLWGQNRASDFKGIAKGSGSGTFNFDGGMLTMECDGLRIYDGVTTTVSANGGTIDTQGHTFTINPVVTGEGTLTLTGGGTVVFAAAPTCNIKVVNGTSVSFAAKPTGALTVERGIVKLTTDATPDVITLGTAGFIEYDLSSITEAGYATNLAENVTITTTDNSPVPEHVIIKNAGGDKTGYCWGVTYSDTTLSATSFDATTTKAGAFTIFTGYYNTDYPTDQPKSWVNGLTTDRTATEKVIVPPSVKNMNLYSNVDCGEFVMSGDLRIEGRRSGSRLFAKSISGEGTLTFYSANDGYGFFGTPWTSPALSCDVNVPVVLSGRVRVKSTSNDAPLKFNRPVTVDEEAIVDNKDAQGRTDPVFNDDVTVNGSYEAKSMLTIASGKTLAGSGKVTGNLAMGAGAKLAVTFDENGAVSPLTVTGNANLTGATAEFSGAENVADVASGTEIVLFKAGTITGWERTVVEIGGKRWRILAKDTDNGQALVAIKGVPGLIILFR